MKTIIHKLIFGVLFTFVSWKGLDGLMINQFSGTLLEIDIEELEKGRDESKRYLKVLNGIAGENYLFYEAGSYSSVDIVYPVFSNKQAEKYKNGEPVTIKLLVRLIDQSRSSLNRGDFYHEDSSSLIGLTKAGLENLQKQDFYKLETDLIKLDENVILLEPGSKPINFWLNFTMFLVGTVFSFTILKSFFRRASSFKEYWEKVTEKNEI